MNHRVSNPFRIAIAVIQARREQRAFAVLERMREYLRSTDENMSPSFPDLLAVDNGRAGVGQSGRCSALAESVPEPLASGSRPPTSFPLAALSSMPPLTRCILVLCVRHHMPAEEISRRFTISRRQVRQHLRSAIAQIAICSDRIGR